MADFLIKSFSCWMFVYKILQPLVYGQKWGISLRLSLSICASLYFELQQNIKLSSSRQFHRISPLPGMAAKCHPRPNSRITHSLPSPFLSELSLIRRMGTNVFGDLNATQRPLLRGQQEHEMTWSSSSLTMPHSHHDTLIPIGDFSSFLSASQQQQALAMGGLSGFTPPLFQQ